MTSPAQQAMWLIGQHDKKMRMLYYRGGHPLNPKAWTYAFSRAKRMTSEQIAAMKSWERSL